MGRVNAIGPEPEKTPAPAGEAGQAAPGVSPAPERKPEPAPAADDTAASEDGGRAGLSRILRGVRDDAIALGRRFDLILPAMAAVVGLLALGGAIIVDQSGRERDALLREEIAELREALQLSSQIIVRNAPATAEQAARAVVSEQMAAAQARLEAIESEIAGLGEAMSAMPAGGAAAGSGAAALDGPTEDCIPLQTRFMVTSGDSYSICRTPVVVDVVDVTSESVILEGVEPIYSGGFTRLGVANCTAMVFSAGVEGYAEMRVAC